MKLVIIVLNKVEYLEKLLTAFAEAGVRGATILDSRGMAHSLEDVDNELRFMGSLRQILDPSHKESKTLFMVSRDEEVSTISAIVNTVTGGLSHPDTGILFTLPVDFVEGMDR